MDWESIIGVVAGTLLPVVFGGIIAIINALRQKNCDNPKCCVTGRKLKSKKKADGKSKG